MSDGSATVVVIGGGQAGLSAGYHLKRRGFVSAVDEPGAARTFVVLDAESAPGGAWRHRWESLRMATVNGIFDLPGFPKPPIDPDEPSRTAVPRYFAAFEAQAGLPILRPVTAERVLPGDELTVETDQGRWRAKAIINATGTWTNPQRPHYPGQETFRGVQLHTHEYVDAARFAGKRVAVVGGGISAVQLLEEISRDATTFWYTRREPVFRDGDFTPEVAGREVIAKVTADVEAGRPTGSVVSYTDLIWTPYALAAKARGALERRPMFTAIEPDGVREADGAFTPVDVILWATGFKAALAHLDPLGLRTPAGGIRLAGTEVAGEPRVHLIGFGPSQSTVGANRAGRDAVRALVTYLGRS
ncbi:cation diffusion facilitator CzcD-associated flavoprotein CzcO [Catenuloplanes nepalensis]|uniref:Cation diffusion facilitator CzcD-associated flavoprotein CzcO n=1 Tax=Catenuloplanes nepalensis TaxID=587533 RepID=A0ABT9MQI5_9ACTN|nr:NAD(P)-binding domain-containing protein [Catenuloplanes nepalensis]MDP9793689.1 cation diffusion facilitator CzcD-associated flavoprotein CzcO [Catenuloplanes nepalensis]